MKVGHNTWISPFSWIDQEGEVEIGENCVIGHEVKIYAHDHFENVKLVDPANLKVNKRKVTIGNNVFIGRGAFILGKCKNIGNNALIGAMAVITKNVPANEVWAGNPAKKIGKRKI